MITINVKKSQFIRDAQESLFVSFPYSLERVNKVKGLQVPKRFYIGAEKAWELPINSINDLISVFDDEEIKIEAERVLTVVKELKSTPEAKKFDAADITDFKFKTDPFPHQVEALIYSKDHSKFLLGDEQGLGKTKQAIDIGISKKGQFKHVLIVCGVNGLKRNWMDEIKIHSNEKGRILGSTYDLKGKLKEGTMEDRLEDLRTLDDIDELFLITNKESLRDVPKTKKDPNTGKNVKKVWPDDFSKQEQAHENILRELEKLIANGTIGMVVVDEIHKMKNTKDGQEGKAILRLRPHYRMAMTGTPLMNKPLDLHVIMNWLEMDRNSYYAFEKRYAVKGGYGGHEIVGYKNTDELRTKLEKIMLRRKKSEVLDLPPKLHQTEYVEMTSGQRRIYSDIKAMIAKNLDKIALDPNPLAQLLRLRQATGYTGIVSESIKESAKLDRMEELVEELVDNGGKAIIFSNWTEITKVAKDRLRKYNPAYITGENNDPNYRQVEKDRFQTDPKCKVIIGTIGAMGTGLTLTAANTVIFLDKPWNPANTEQAEDRAHRIGTTGTVTIVTLVTEGTIDERIEEILAEKGDIFDALIDGKMHKMAKYEMLERLVS